MLCLTARLGERIIIGDKDNPIIVEVIRITKTQTKLGITASEEINIAREKVFKENHPEIVLPPAKGGIDEDTRFMQRRA